MLDTETVVDLKLLLFNAA